jgi:hypothetical protein
MEAGNVEVPQQEPKRNTTTNLRIFMTLEKLRKSLKIDRKIWLA